MLPLLLSSLTLLLGLAILRWTHSRGRLEVRLEPVAPPASGPLISVCVPARNEERSLRRCLESLLAQDYPNYELIVVDDRSTDSTPRLLQELAASHPRLQALHGAELPPGWAGKPHALHQAALAARGEWLCFVDADTFLAPAALSASLAAALQTRADLFTLLTFQEMGSFWEKTILPLVMTALSVGFSPARVNDPSRRDAIANGQFILIRRSVYAELGGHAAIRGSIVEDKALAERVKWSGRRLVLADGAALARTRMYTSLPALWEGWTKNVYLGLRDRPDLLLLGAFGALLLLAACLLLPLLPLPGLLWYLRGGGWRALAALLEALLLWAAVLAARARAARGMGLSGWWALTTPLGAGVFAAIMIVSAWKVLSGRGVTWKGRTYTP